MFWIRKNWLVFWVLVLPSCMNALCYSSLLGTITLLLLDLLRLLMLRFFGMICNWLGSVILTWEDLLLKTRSFWYVAISSSPHSSYHAELARHGSERSAKLTIRQLQISNNQTHMQKAISQRS